MRLLEEKILQDAQILPRNILKVDSFLNHQVDPQLMMAMGQDMADHFATSGATKVLTLEVSGITLAMAAAFYLRVPMIFAKKIASVTLTHDVYSSVVESYTKKRSYEIKVDKQFLTPDDKVLIVDDFLATGAALKGMTNICEQAGAAVVGYGIAIEKVFQTGGNRLRELGFDVYSQARISEFVDGSVKFEH